MQFRFRAKIQSLNQKWSRLFSLSKLRFVRARKFHSHRWSNPRISIRNQRTMRRKLTSERRRFFGRSLATSGGRTTCLYRSITIRELRVKIEGRRRSEIVKLTCIRKCHRSISQSIGSDPFLSVMWNPNQKLEKVKRKMKNL